MRCAPVVLGTIAALWLVLTVGLLLEPSRRTAAERPGLGARWTEAAQRSLRIFDAPIATLRARLGTAPRTSRLAAAQKLGLPTLRISIAPQHEAKLAEQAELAMDRGILLGSPDAFVPAWVELGDRTLRAKIRLKGDWADHLRSGRWSLRVRLRDGDLFGMRSFSLHAAKTRGGHGEILLLDAMRDAGIVAPRSFPVAVQLNQRDFGVQLVEEHFDTHLLEANARRPGLILAFDEGRMWEQKLRNRQTRAREGLAPAPLGETDAMHEDDGLLSLAGAGTMPIRGFRIGRLLKDGTLRRQFETAVGLLRGYLRGDLVPEEVFDMTLWARHHCLVSLWGSRHGLATHNLRVYFNPITRRLEPVAFDNNAAARNLEAPVAWEWARLVRGFESAEFRSECRRFLAEYRASLDRENLRTREQHLHSIRAQLGDHPERVPVDRLPARCGRLGAMPFPIEELAGGRLDLPDRTVPELDHPPAALVTPYWLIHAGQPRIELVQCVRADLVIDRILWTDGRKTETLNGVSGTALRAGVDRRTTIDFTVPWAPNSGHTVHVDCRLRTNTGRLGPPTRHTATIGAPAKQHPLLPRVSIAAFRAHPAVAERAGDGDEHELVVVPGEWTFDSDWITPANCTLRLSAGTKLRFAPGARLIVRGSLIADGTEQAPVDLGPREASWGGVVVLGTQSTVRLAHTRVHDTAPPSDPEWTLTGAVTMHRCTVDLVSCHFERTEFEDALNLVRSQFTIRDCRFAHTRSDAFDGDATTGSVRGSHFTAIGGDALDFSFSDVRLRQITAGKVTDKAVSIGERSTCEIDGMTADSIGVGVVAKDGSRVKVRGATITNAGVAGLMAYVKKPEFGTASLEAERIECPGASLARVQRGSTLLVDGTPAAAEAIDVETLYRTVMRKKR